MAIQTDFCFIRNNDGTITVTMTPPVAIGGWTIMWSRTHRFGSDDFKTPKWYSPGFNGVSGITVVNSGQGIFNIRLNSVDTSGLQAGNYANSAVRLNSGSITTLTEGYMTLGY